MDLKNNKFAAENALVVMDSAAANSREILNAYIYDFLLKSGLNSSAAAFFKEANLPIIRDNEKVSDRYFLLNSKELPKSQMTIDTPQGFISEWWQVFWDIFNSRTGRPCTNNANQYSHFATMKQNTNQMNAANPQQPPVHNQSTDSSWNQRSFFSRQTPQNLQDQQNPQNMPNLQQQQQHIPDEQHLIQRQLTGTPVLPSVLHQQQAPLPQQSQPISQNSQPTPQINPSSVPQQGHMRTQQQQQSTPQQHQPQQHPTPQHQQPPTPQQLHQQPTSHQLQQHPNQLLHSQSVPQTPGQQHINTNIRGNMSGSVGFAVPQQNQRVAQQPQMQKPNFSSNNMMNSNPNNLSTQFGPHNYQPQSNQPQNSYINANQNFSENLPLHSNGNQQLPPQQTLKGQQQVQGHNQFPQQFPPYHQTKAPNNGIQNQPNQIPSPHEKLVQPQSSQIAQNVSSTSQHHSVLQQKADINASKNLQQLKPQRSSPNDHQRVDSDLINTNSLSRPQTEASTPATISNQQHHHQIMQQQIQQQHQQQQNSQPQPQPQLQPQHQPQPQLQQHHPQNQPQQQQHHPHHQLQQTAPTQQQSQFPPSQLQQVVQQQHNHNIQQPQQPQHPQHQHIQQPQQQPQLQQVSQRKPHPEYQLNGKLNFPNEGVREYGESLRILESENRKRLRGMDENEKRPVNSNHFKVEPAPQFAEFSNMLGQLQQNSSLKSPSNGVSPSAKSPTNKRSNAPSTGIPTPLTNGANSTGANTSVIIDTVATSKKKTRRLKANSVPATPKTPNNVTTPQLNKSATPNGSNATTKRPRKKAYSSATTPVIKEDIAAPLRSVTENIATHSKPAENKRAKKPKLNKNVTDKTSSDEKKTSNSTGTKNNNNNNNSISKTQEKQNKSSSANAENQQAEQSNESNGFSIDTDAQFLGDFNGSEQFFDFGLYNGEDGSEMVPDFWGDPVNKT